MKLECVDLMNSMRIRVVCSCSVSIVRVVCVGVHDVVGKKVLFGCECEQQREEDEQKSISMSVANQRARYSSTHRVESQVGSIYRSVGAFTTGFSPLSFASCV